jgi:multidrug efflux pump subunit AcrA (membrane-fusion protein)
VKRTVWVWLIVAGIVLAAGLMVSRGATPKSGGPAGVQSGDASRRARATPTVTVGHPKPTTLPRTLQLTASISSMTQSAVSSKTPGYLLAVNVRPGDTVRAGQVVALVDHAQLDAQVAQAQATLVAAENAVQTAQAQVSAARAQRVNAEAGLASARAGVVKAEAQLADSQSTYNRTAELAKQGAIAQQNLDDAKAQVVSAQATVDAARAQVAQAQAQVEAARQQEAAAASQVKTQQAQAATQAAALENARLSLGNATIIAPFGGVVISRSLDPGAYVAPGSSTPIITIADLDHLNALVNVAAPDLPLIHRGERVAVSLDSYPGQTFAGTVTRIAGGADPQTRTVLVEISLTNPGRMLRPGMYATVAIAAGSRQTLIVPLSALVSIGPQHFVWLVQGDKVMQRNVTIGQASGDVVEVTGGLAATDQIVFSGIDVLREGQTIRGVAVTP